MNTAASAPRSLAASTSPIATFARFVVCGGGVTLLGSAMLMAIGDRMNLAIANALVTIVTTLIATELHGRFSFQSEKKGLAVHAQSALTIFVAYLFTTGAMMTLKSIDPNASVVLEQAVYLTASGIAGLARFLVMRLFIFAAKTEAKVEAQELALAA